MWIWRTHPADTTLILALDRELNRTRRAALDRHLVSCEECRSRFEAFGGAAREAAHVCREDMHDDAATAALRRRLQGRMLEIGREWDRSMLFRLRRMVFPVPGFAQTGVAAAVLAMVLWLLQSGMTVTIPQGPSPRGSLPISRFTPGATSQASVLDLCSGSTPARRVVSAAVRQQVVQQYRMEHVSPSEYELDYLITPELGGVGDVRNLWPQRYDSEVWNARVKDDLERLLPRLVCDGAVDLARAQQDIAGDWIGAYKKYFNTEWPIPGQARLLDDDDEIQIETVARADSPGVTLASFVRPAVRLSAELTAKDAPLVARVGRVAW